MEYHLVLKKQLSIDTSDNIDEPWKHATWKKPNPTDSDS
jgi:hypothetical protein